MSGPSPPRIWVLIDDRAGNASQCLGVAEALRLAFEERHIRYAAAATLPNAMLGSSFGGLTRESRDALRPPWPDLVIAAGRRTAPVARAIKRLNRGSTFLAQVMHPGPPGAEEFDLIAVPRHDRRAPASNHLEILGAPHRIMPKRLVAEARRWRGRVRVMPKPRIALVVGGRTRRRPFTEAMAGTLGRMVAALARGAGGSVMATTSRRTGRAATASLQATLSDPCRFHRWGEGDDNPYVAFLGLADAVVVTGDSVSMCSEACATGGPVYIFAPPELITRKHDRLHEDLYTAGYARPLEERLESWRHPRLNPAVEIAAAIHKGMGV